VSDSGKPVRRALLAARLVRRDAGGQVEAQPEDAPGVDVYHGSPHYFDRFDMSKIGTGEGNQAYGRGLYFAQDEGIAKGYRDRLSRDKDPRIDLGTGRGPQTVDDITHADNLHQDHMFTLMDFIDAGGDWDALHKKIENDFYPKHVPKFKQHAAEMRAKYPQAKLHTPGAMYQVRLNADPEHFLHWDRPVKAQHPHVQAAVKTLFNPDWHDRAEAMTGQDLHKFIAAMAPQVHTDKPRTQNAKAQAHAMERLKAAGIPGIRYLDANSRSGKRDAHNFVVFDDRTPEIKRRYERGGRT
jgi:hypothetical protein